MAFVECQSAAPSITGCRSTGLLASASHGPAVVVAPFCSPAASAGCVSALRSPAVAAAVVATSASMAHCRARRKGCRGKHARTRCAAKAVDAPVVRLGHDGSADAAKWLEVFDARGLRGPGVELLSPPGHPSVLPQCVSDNMDDQPPGKVFAVLPSGQLLRCLESQSWALEQPCIGRDHEWANWDYAQSLMGSRWGQMYEWEYYRFLRPASEARTSSVLSSQEELLELRSHADNTGSTASRWWQNDASASSLWRMLETQGFCVVDDFLDVPTAESVSSSAQAAWKAGRMGRGRLTSGDSFARGDAVLWVSTEDPALAAGETPGLVPEEGQASMAAAELGPMLDLIDNFVTTVVAQRSPPSSRARQIATRSRAMFTCYPAAKAEDVVLGGPSFSGSSSSRGYLRHVDNDRLSVEGRDNGRVLTTILYLNKDWLVEDRGALRMFETDPPLQCRAEVLPLFNRLIAFWADEVPHEVMPPARDRFACSFWYLDRSPGLTAVAFDSAPATTLAPPSDPGPGSAGAATMFLD